MVRTYGWAEVSLESPQHGDELLTQLLAGQPFALERLLFREHDRLFAYIQRKFPADLRGIAGPEDVLQETFAQVCEQADRFKPDGPDSFYRWAATIARNRLMDLIKAQRAAKRGGKAERLTLPEARDHSVVELFSLLRADEPAPSRRAMTGEALAAMRIAIANLGPEMRRAIEMRYLQGLGVAEVATAMGRTERAIHQLCHRALKRLRSSIGRASDFLSWSS
jgi:RNA polymerase sigma-70 factor, ECF subfamily